MRGEMDQLRRKASIDALTKTWNRGAILEILAKEQERAKKANEPLAVALMDIDHFKSINDAYGDDVGDQVLQEFTDRIRASLRGGEAFGRFGGEEFLIVIPRCNPSQSAIYGENVLQALRAGAGDFLKRPFRPEDIVQSIHRQLRRRGQRAPQESPRGMLEMLLKAVESLARSVLALARELGLQVIAEGVETAGQARVLKAHGCDVAQGFHFSPPLSPEAVPAFVNRERGS